MRQVKNREHVCMICLVGTVLIATAIQQMRAEDLKKTARR
jgi:hypothetical protein